MKWTKFFSLPTVPAATPVKPSSKRVFSLQALICLVVWVSLFGFVSLAPLPSYAATNCGGQGERACCLGERIPSCNQGLHEVLGCSGNCTCGGFNPLNAANSIGHCEANPPPHVITVCGGPGQRACCVTERPGQPSCNPGYHEVLGCNTGNCVCGGPNPLNALKSIGHCEANQVITACGGPGQRACCVTERPGQPSCNQGFHEVLGCNTGNCVCGGPNPLNALKSIGHCEANPVITACGGPGQRACCVTERPGQPSCNAGFHEVLGCNTGNCLCGGPNPLNALKSIGHCEAETCGGLNQRACCVTERIPSCNQGLHEVLGCTGPNCKCGGANPLGALNSIGHCEANPVITACGGPGQRACCITERPGQPSCNAGYHEVLGCTTGNCTCGGPNPLNALKSIGHCEAKTCGGLNQRACCVTERITSCDLGLHQVLGCTGQDCKCGGANPLGALNSVGHCEGDCAGAQSILSKLEAELAAARQAVQQFCGQGGTPPAQQQFQTPLPLIKQVPLPLKRQAI